MAAQAQTGYAVIGGGVVGASLAYGIARSGADVALLDEGDVAFRAARGNFGNVWVQGKGANEPRYADLTRRAANDWPSFAAELGEVAGIDLHFRRPGGFYLCFSAEELQRRAAMLAALEARAEVPGTFETLDNAGLRKALPDIGPAIAGATYCAGDGTANPLHLLRALIRAVQRLGGTYRPRQRVERIRADGAGFIIETAAGTLAAGRVVLAAGLGNIGLAPGLGLRAPVRPVRGQIMVTEKVRPFLAYGTNFIRQTGEGGCLFGESSEEAGFDEGTTLPVLRETARRALLAFPLLRHVGVVRCWGALRVMSPDGLPIYQQSARHPGAFLVSVHSGITLAPIHARDLAEAVTRGDLGAAFAVPFSPDRFDARDDRAA